MQNLKVDSFSWTQNGPWRTTERYHSQAIFEKNGKKKLFAVFQRHKETSSKYRPIFFNPFFFT